MEGVGQEPGVLSLQPACLAHGAGRGLGERRGRDSDLTGMGALCYGVALGFAGLESHVLLKPIPHALCLSGSFSCPQRGLTLVAVHVAFLRGLS